MSACARSCQRPPRSRGEFLPHLVPDVLRVDDDAVEVEDDGFDVGSHARHVVAADLSCRGDAREPHREVEVGAEVPDDLANAVLATCREPPDVGPAEADRRSAEREGAEDVGAGANPAVEDDRDAPRDRLGDARAARPSSRSRRRPGGRRGSTRRSRSSRARSPRAHRRGGGSPSAGSGARSARGGTRGRPRRATDASTSRRSAAPLRARARSARSRAASPGRRRPD